MLYKAKSLKGYKLHSLDGDIGKVKEFYFDDHHWTVRYLIADTGGWLTGRQVLISPYALLDVNQAEKTITVDLTKKQIEDSPSLRSDKPVSKQFEDDYFGYYGWPEYWTGQSMWGNYAYPERDDTQWIEAMQEQRTWDPDLRSTHDVNGRHIEALDGAIGHVDDFIIDDENWAIRYLVVDTRNVWPGKKVLVSPHWIKRISWDESKVFVDLSRNSIKQSPEYKEKALLSRSYETELHRHYKRQGYWVDEKPAEQRTRGLNRGTHVEPFQERM
jgi:hypothetical protein